MSMFRFPLMKQVVSGLFSKKEKKTNRKERHLVMDALESRELLTVTAASTTSFYVNELPIYETSSDIIEQIQNLRDNNLSIDYDLGGDDDGDLVVVWERPDVIYTSKTGVSQYEPVIDSTTLSPALDWNIYARYLTNETQRLYLDYDYYNNKETTVNLFYGQMQNLDPDNMVNNPSSDTRVDTKVASGLVYKISFTSEAQPLTSTQESINARFSIYAYDNSGQSTVSTFTFNEEYPKALSIDAETEEDVLNYTNSMETNAAELQAKLRGLGQTQGKYLNDCVVKAISPTEFYVYVYSEDIQATWDDTANTWKWVDVNSKDSSIPHLAIYQENPEGNDAAGFEVSAEISVVSAPCLYNFKVNPMKPLDTADNIQHAFDAKKNTNLMAPIFMPAPDRINAQRRDILEGPATESDMLISGGIYPEVLVVPVFGLTDADGNSLDGYVYDITFVGNSSYINHPLLTALADNQTTSLSENPVLTVKTIKESSPEFRVNSLEESDPADSDDPFKEVEYYNQLNPAVAMDADGDFVITWQSEVSNTLVRGSYIDIYAKTYSARSYIDDYSYLNDAWVEDESEKKWPSDMMVNKVDTYTYIEVDPDDYSENYYKKDSRIVYIQSVVETSKEFRVNTSTTNAQRNPDVAMDLDGNFVIVWDSEGQTISYFNGVYMQRYDKDGKAISSETRVDTEVTGASTNPSVAADDNGQFVVTWEYTNNPLIDIQFPYYTFFNHYFNYYYETDFYYMSEIHAAIYSVIYPIEHECYIIEPEFVVGGTDNAGGKDPQAAWSDTGDLVISWTGLESDTDTSGEISSGVYAEQYKSETVNVFREVDAATYFKIDNITEEQARSLTLRNLGSFEAYKIIWRKYNGDVSEYLKKDATSGNRFIEVSNVPEPTDEYMQDLLSRLTTLTDTELRTVFDWFTDTVKNNADSVNFIYHTKVDEKTSSQKVRDVYRINSGTFNIDDNPTYWDYSQIVGDVGLDADGDIIVTYAGYGPDVSVNSLIPYVKGTSLSTTGSYTLFLTNMTNLLKMQTQILQTKYGVEPFADLSNFFNPTGNKTGSKAGDYFDSITKNKVDEDGTLVTFTSKRMQDLLTYLKHNPFVSDEIKSEIQDLTGTYECHGDVNSVIAMVLTNAQLLFKYDPQYETLRQNEVEFKNVQNVVLGALASVLESQFGLLRGESSGVMFTQIDAAVDQLTDDGEPTNYAPSTIIHSDSVANNKRDGVTSVANIALDVSFNRIWDNISLTLLNKANQQTEVVAVDLFGLAYEDVGDGLYELNKAKAAEAIEQAISDAVNVVGTSWRDETNRELDLYEGPVEVRAIDWNELLSRGLMHIGNEASRYSNASMDMEMFHRWYNENAAALAFEFGVNRFEEFTFDNLVAFINDESLTELEHQARVADLPVVFEIVFQGSVHDLELSLTWENATVRNAEVQNLVLNPSADDSADGRKKLYYAIQVNGEPDAFENPSQLLTFDCTDEKSVRASITQLQGYLYNLGYNPVDVELVSSPTDDDGNETWGFGSYQIRIGFVGNVGDNIATQYYGTFVLPPLTDEGGYNPLDYPWLSSGQFEVIQNGGTLNRERARFGVSMYYYGDLGTPQTDATINVTPEGDFQIGYLQHELYNSRTMSNQYANSTYNSYSNTNVLVRAFDEATDTAGPKVSGLALSKTVAVDEETGEVIRIAKRIQQDDEINEENVQYIIVYFNEEMMYYNRDTKYKNSESAEWDNSVINPSNWSLVKDGSVLVGAIDEIFYGMNMSQEILDEDGNALTKYGSNKWEAVIKISDSCNLTDGVYELIARKNIEDVKGNRLNKNGENPEGSDESYTFRINQYSTDQVGGGDDLAKLKYFEKNIEPIDDYRWSPNAVGINGDGDTVTVWISEYESGHENIVFEIGYSELVIDENGSYVYKTDEKDIRTIRLFDDNGVDPEMNAYRRTVNDYHNIQHASVDMGEDGDFVITWSEYNLDSSTGKYSWDVYARRYNLDGTPKDSLPTQLKYEEGANDHESLRVNLQTLGDQMYSSVSVNALGNYAITWMSMYYQDPAEIINADWDIYATQFYADGTRVVDDIATQEIIFTSAINEGSFVIEYSPNLSDYLLQESDQNRRTSVITVKAPEGDEAFGTIEYNGVSKSNTPDNFALVIQRALKDVGIDTSVEANGYDFFTVKFNQIDDAPVSANLGKLAIKPQTTLHSSEKVSEYSNEYKTVNTTVRVKYPADAGEILVNESFMLQQGVYETQRMTLRNIVPRSAFFEFSYTDADGVVHDYISDNAADFYDEEDHRISPDYGWTSNDYHPISELESAFASFKDINTGETLENPIRIIYNSISATEVEYEFVHSELRGYDISDLRMVKVDPRYGTLEVGLLTTTITDGFGGGINSDPYPDDIVKNPQNYYDLESNNQMFPDIALDDAGNFIVTWTSYGDAELGSSIDSNVYARRYTPEGETLSVGLVNTDNRVGNQMWSSVAVDRTGDFVITWTSEQNGEYDVYAKRYAFLKAYYYGDAEKSPYDEAEYNQNDTPHYLEPYYSKNGRLFSYRNKPVFFHSDGAEDDGNVVIENYLDLEYRAMGDSFIVNTTQVGKQQYSKVSTDADGNFIITWESDDASFTESEKAFTIYAQKYLDNSVVVTSGLDAAKDGSEMKFSHTGANVEDHAHRFPAVSMNSDGDWIVAWTCFPDNSTDGSSEIYQVVHRVNPYEDKTSPVITKFQAVSPVEQGDLFIYALDNNGDIITDKLGNPVFTWSATDDEGNLIREQLYAVNDNNEIYSVDEQGNITSRYNVDEHGNVTVEPLNNPENPIFVLDTSDPDELYLDVYQLDQPTTQKSVTISDELPYDDFSSNGLLNYIFTNNPQSGEKEYAYTDSKDSYLDIGNGKIYNSEYKTQDFDHLISEHEKLDENGEQIVALIVGFSEEMSTSGSSSVLNPGNWHIYQNDVEGNEVLVPIEDIVLREDSMFATGDDKKNEIVIYLKPGEDGLPALESGYRYEFIGSTNMEDKNRNPLDGSYSQWELGKENGRVGGTESTDFVIDDKDDNYDTIGINAGIPSDADLGNVSEEPEKFTAADLEYDTLVNWQSLHQAGVQENSAVAMDQYGNYIVVWETDWHPDDSSSSKESNNNNNYNSLGLFLYEDGKLVAQSVDNYTHGFRRVMAQVFDYEGKPVGESFIVYDKKYEHQSQPDVAMDKYGNIVVTWIEVSDNLDNHINDSFEGDREKVILDPFKDGSNVFAIRYKFEYDENDHVSDLIGHNLFGSTEQEQVEQRLTYGDKYGQQFQVDNDVRGVKNNPKVAVDSTTGNFVIVWSNEDYNTYPESVLVTDNYYPDGVVDRNGVYARVYSFSDSDGEPDALDAMEKFATDRNDYNKPFLVNYADEYMQSKPVVAMENGNLAIVWQTNYLRSAIEGRSFKLNNSGQVVEMYDQVRISVNSDGSTGAYKDKNGNIILSKFNNQMPSIDMDSKGNAVIAYSSNLQDGSEKGIYARTFQVDLQGNQKLNSLSPEFRVNKTTYDDQFEPVVGLTDDGRCVISWISFGQELSDYDASTNSRYSYGVFAKWFDDVYSPSNVKYVQQQRDVQINSLIYGSQFQQDISVNPKGECVFTWTGPGDLNLNYPPTNNLTLSEGNGENGNGGNGNGGNGNNGNGNNGNSGGEGQNTQGTSSSHLTNTHDNLVNGSTMSGVSNHVSVLDYSDIYRRRFVWTSPSPSSLSSDYELEETGVNTPQTHDIGDNVQKTVIFSMSDGSWMVAQDNEDPQQINANILDVDANGSDIDLYGSLDADTVRFRTINGKDVVEMTNSLGQRISLSNFGSVNVFGRSGNDTVIFENEKGTEPRKFVANGNTATLSTSSYAYSVYDFNQIGFKGEDGDKVEIQSTEGNDAVALSEDSVAANGDDYSITAQGFSNLKLNGGNGADRLTIAAKNIVSLSVDGADGTVVTGVLDDNGKIEKEIVTVGGKPVEQAKVQYSCDFSGFDNVSASVTNGASEVPDVSLNVTSPDAALYMYSNKVMLSENGKDIVLTNFGNVTANIEPEAAKCQVRIYDSKGNDSYLFDAPTKTATMSLANGYKLTAIGTAAAEAYSKFGGTDTATFNDSAKVDTLKMIARSMTMTDGDIDDPKAATNSYYVTASGFAVNNANSTDNQDAVRFEDETVIAGSTSTNDVKDDFTVTCLDNKVMAFMQSSAKTTYSNTAWGFNNIVATSRSNSSVDTAHVSDGQGDLAAINFNVDPDSINVVLTNGATIDVNGFRNKFVESTESTINLSDGISDDTLVIQENKASMSGDGVIFGANANSYTITAQAPAIVATSGSGMDKATVICSDDEVESIIVNHTGESVTVQVKNDNATFNNTIKDFKSTTVTRANDQDSANVVIVNSAYEMPISAQSYINKFTYSQDGAYSRGVSISGALKSLDFHSDNAGKLSAVNVSLHDSAVADLLDVTTSERKAVIEQVATQQTRSFVVSGDDMITVSGDSSLDTKKVDGVLTDWDDWSDTDSWLKGE